MFLIIKITNHQTKEKVINTESNVTLKLIYKCFVVGNNCWRQNFPPHDFISLATAPHQYYHGFWINLFQSPKKSIFTQNDAKAYDPKPMVILS